jgi:hypothetical protein
MSIIKTNAIQTVAGKPIVNSTGSILNVAYKEYTTQFISTSVQTYEIFYSLSVTATASNSRYLLIGNAHSWNNAPSYGRNNMGYSVTIGGVTTRILGVDGPNGDSWGYPAVVASGALGCFMNRQGIYTSSASAGTTLTFNFLVACWEGLGYFNPNTLPSLVPYSHKSTFTIMEISS